MMQTESRHKILRQTNQRKIILEELQCLTCHPTAAALHDLVKKRLPRVSLGTVYRNLELLSDCGTIQKLDFGEPHKRFDGNPTPHYHVNCQQCGRVDDVPMPLHPILEDEASIITHYQISGHHVAFSGVCPHCHGKKSD
ncbi:MAG: transcriptional repressor [Proteobacteria bacterium]|nr:transcriptional repressor [Pseudomonadota bacterium]MBU1688897.1 transcriptional repressor [Pseudomonadota bacterium]